jgi:ribulose-phosphate 3-epimerase
LEVILKNIVSASILSADMSKISETVKMLESSNVDWLHFDVMDGVFVDNISFGIPVLEATNKCTDMFMDVHLMIINPLKYIEQFAAAGADMITFHYESESDVMTTINKIHSLGLKAGISIRPNTSVDVLIDFLDIVDMVLIMSVEPGFGGQGFIPESLEKVKFISEYYKKANQTKFIQIDGGINDKTAPVAVEAGVNALVSGSYLFKSANITQTVKNLQNC